MAEDKAEEEIYLDPIVGEYDDAAPVPPPNHNTNSVVSSPSKQSGIFGTSSNLVNTIVGSGMIGIPYAFKESGFISGVLLLLLVGWMTDKSLRIIVGIANFHPKLKNRNIRTYEDLMNCSYGKAGANFALASMIFLAYGSMISYLIVVKDTIPILINYGDTTAQKNIVMFISSLILILPLCMQRDMAELALTSFFSVSADIVLAGIVAALCPIQQTVSEAGGIGEILSDDWADSTIFIGLGILSTALACQHSVFIVSGSLKDITKNRWNVVTFNSITIATIVCLIFGIFGYLGFLDDTDSDILNNFSNESTWANIGRGLLGITMFFTYPMECFVARHVLIKLLYNGDMDGPRDETTGKPRGEFCCGCLNRRHAITLGIFTATMIPGLAFSSLGTVLSVTGSVGASCLSYIAPGLIYIGINGDDFLRRANASCKNVTTKPTADEADLPVEGDVTQTMRLREDSGVVEYPSGKKPWWWFPALMPIWCSLAMTGVQQMHDQLTQEGALSQENSSIVRSAPSSDEETYPPQVVDYAIAVFFISFGSVALVAGVTSNIYESL